MWDPGDSTSVNKVTWATAGDGVRLAHAQPAAFVEVKKREKEEGKRKSVLAAAVDAPPHTPFAALITCEQDRSGNVSNQTVVVQKCLNMF